MATSVSSEASCRRRPCQWTIAGLVITTLGLQAAGLIAYLRGWASHVPIGYGADLPALVASHGFGFASMVVGLVVVRDDRRNTVGWILLALGLAEAAIISGLFVAAVQIGSGAGASATVTGWLASTLLQTTMGALVALLMLVFPNGRFLARQWRWVAVASVLGAAIRFVEIGFGSGSITYLPTVASPVSLPGLAGDLARESHEHQIGLVVMVAAIVSAVASLAVRYRGAGPTARRQLRWFGVAGVLVSGSALALLRLFTTVEPREGEGQAEWIAFFVAASLQPVAIWIAIRRHRLYEIDRIINRAFVYGAMTAILAGTFTASITLSQRLFIGLTGESSDLPVVLTTLIVATSYTTVRRRLELIAERHLKYETPVFGPFRDGLRQALAVLDPVETARHLLDQAVRELGATGGLVELRTPRGDLTVDTGTMPDGDPAVVVEPGSNAVIRRLALGPRQHGAPYRPRDVEALTELVELSERIHEMRLAGVHSARRRRPLTPQPRLDDVPGVIDAGSAGGHRPVLASPARNEAGGLAGQVASA